MKIRNIIIVLAIIAVNSIHAQNTIQYIPVLEEDNVQNSIMTKGDYYLESLNNIGDTENEELESIIKKYYAYSEKPSNEKARWMFTKWLKSVENKDDATTYVSIDYSFSNGTKVEELRLKEKTGRPSLPYFQSTKINYVDVKLILTVNYADGSPTAYDTLHVRKESKVIPGKSYDPVDELKDWGIQRFKWRIRDQLYFVDSEKVQFNFPKVKIKDKQLKEEYKKVKSLLKEGEYKQAGIIAKKVYDAEQKPEQAQALGLCYELVGNYPKALEMFKISSDFHINVRMKKNMKILDFARSIGYEPEFIEFE